jgi:hypothetical protein
MGWIDDVADADAGIEILRMDGYDDCVVGLVERFGQDPILCYDKAKILAKMVADGMTEEEAEEFFEFNQIGAWVGVGTPCFLTSRPEPLKIL